MEGGVPSDAANRSVASISVAGTLHGCSVTIQQESGVVFATGSARSTDVARLPTASIDRQSGTFLVDLDDSSVTISDLRAHVRIEHTVEDDPGLRELGAELLGGLPLVSSSTTRRDEHRVATEAWFGACPPFVAAGVWVMVDGLWFPVDSEGEDSVALDPTFPWVPSSAERSDDVAVVAVARIEQRHRFSPTGSVAGRAVTLCSYLAPWRAGSVVAVVPAETLPGSAPDGFPWRTHRNGTVDIRPSDLEQIVVDPAAPAIAPTGFAPYALAAH
ncbi:hypothetical protein BIU90_01485 [Curtobacterium sp. MCBA15_001]|nr:hypothetical protein BIU90_01485 [Curtobacterium sp. MCBA15_001]